MQHKGLLPGGLFRGIAEIVTDNKQVIMSMKRKHLLVSGKVQGVSYRAYTEQKARALGLTGIVRNLADGRVEILAEGDEAGLQSLEEWAWDGSPLAEVSGVVAEQQSATGEFDDFRTVS